MIAKLFLFMSMAACVAVLSGCVPLVVGAGGAIAADTIAEDRGSDLF